MSPILILGIGGAIAIVLLVIGIATTVTTERSLVQERLGRYANTTNVDSKGRGPAPTPVVDWLNRRMEGSSIGDKISKMLARADIKMKPGEYIALVIIAAFVVGLVAYFIGGKFIIVGVIGAAIGCFLPGMYVKQQQTKRLRKFDEELPDMLNLMVNGLRAGYSTMQAMEAVSKELPPPICDEFRRVVQEMQIGIPMEAALENLLRRIPSEDLDFMVTAINVQREVGGNLSEILDTISFTIRERVRIKGEIRVMTAQVRTSGLVLSMVPLFLALMIWFISPTYLSSFLDDGPVCAGALVALIIILIGLGYFVMMRIADIEV